MCRRSVWCAAAVFVILCSVSSAQTDKADGGRTPSPSPLPSPSPGAEKTAPAPAATPAPPTFEQALNVQTMAENILRGGLPSAEGFKALAEEKGVTRVLCLLADGDDIADIAVVTQAAKDAGLTFERVPFVLDLSSDTVVVDRAALDAVIAALDSAKGVTYVCDRLGFHEVGVVDFLYQYRVVGRGFAEALRGTMERGFRAYECPGIIDEFKRIASGLEKLPIVKGIPITDRDLSEPGKTVAVGGQRLNVKTFGSGPPVYVLHGGPGETHKPLRPYLDDLQKTHTVVYYDQRGCGRSSKPQFVEAYTLARLSKELDGLREALGHEKISLVAHSTGAALALDYAFTYRDRLDKVVIVGGWAAAKDVVPYTSLIARMFTGKRLGALIELLQKIRRERRTYNDREMSRLLRLAYPLNFFGTFTRSFSRDWGRRSEVSAFTNMALSPQVFGSYDVTERLAELNGLPTLVIAGEYDIITPPSVVKPIADGIEGARFEILPLCGHYSFVEKHAEFIEMVTKFLQGDESKPQPQQ